MVVCFQHLHTVDFRKETMTATMIGIVMSRINDISYRVREAIQRDSVTEQQVQRCLLMGIDPQPMLKSGSGLFDAVERTPGLFDSNDRPVDAETADRVRAVWGYDRFVGGRDRTHFIALQEERYREQANVHEG